MVMAKEVGEGGKLVMGVERDSFFSINRNDNSASLTLSFVNSLV